MQNNSEGQETWCSTDFVELTTLGTGAMAVVKKVMHRVTGDVFALKVVSKQTVIENDMQKHMQREIKTHVKLQHPNIIRMYGFFDNTQDICLLMEYAPLGNLYTHLHQQPLGRVEQVEAIQIFVQVVDALVYLHGLGVAHRDLKPENVLLCEASVAKVADFGWCADSLVAGSKRQTFCGTREYLSPELLSGEDHDHRVDVWATGALLYEMLVGSPPFIASSLRETFRQVCKADISFPLDMSPHARELIQQLMQKRPEDRLSLEGALTHDFIKSRSQGFDNRDERLDSNVPEQRCSGLILPDALSRSCNFIESTQASASVVTEVLAVPRVSNSKTINDEVPFYPWSSFQQNPPSIQDIVLVESNGVQDRLSTRTPSSEASSSGWSPCNLNNANQQEDYDFNQDRGGEEWQHRFLWNAPNFNTKPLEEDNMCNHDDRDASGVRLGMLLKAPTWASSKMSENMQKVAVVASTVTATISGITADLDLWNHRCSDGGNEQPLSQQAQKSMDITFSSKSGWAHLDSHELQDDGSTAASNFILGSALIPTRSHTWEALDESSKSIFTLGSLEPGESLRAWRPFEDRVATFSSHKEFTSEQSSNEYQLEQSSRFPETSKSVNVVGRPLASDRLLPDAEELLDQLQFEH
eukprot:gnl/MRDRNA2_/MRDRNA2_106015_c0_seq1.p1 gnl/MRDRNA2_/MRDRNA2_106015_c0~~gnl/MRDRNA2_/MRDRNA2_106015_c0_seq1.p1  ORF type:complete len:640 (+),score=107.10 gnl/MRDRNA2_/MRDRNA2_106015_c0_seq1:109-2028(+)